MKPTPVSLLDRLRIAPPDDPDWARMQGIYLPLVERWLARVPGLGDEAHDLAQEVLIIVFREIPRFHRQREGSFRAWLRQVTLNRVRTDRRRRLNRPGLGLEAMDAFLDRLAEPNSELAREWDLEHDRHVFRRLQSTVQPQFAPATWEAFRRFALDGVPAAQVADELGMSVNAVLLAKSRILKRLRDEAGDLID